jgi:NhaC family Na+:H+ antiporter
MEIEFSLLQVLTLIIVTLAGVVWAVTAHFPLVAGFFPGFLFLVFLGTKKKLGIRQILQTSLEGINKTRIVIFILFLVSFLLPSWYLSGTIKQMVNISLYFITPNHFILLSFIIAMAVSLLLGTTIGTLSSIGIPILGTASVLHLPIEIVAGALVSGAFVGDRTSPFSSSHQLLAHTVEIPVKQQWKAMRLTTFIAIIICLCFYGLYDTFITVNTGLHEKPLAWDEFSVIKFIPPLILILFVALRMKITYAFLSSILSAIGIALGNGVPLFTVISSLWNGINGLGGGFIHMYELLLFLALAGAYNGLLEKLNVVQPYLDKWLKSSSSLFVDTLKTIAATMLITLIAANQTLPIILTGRSFLPHWSRKYGKDELARIMGDSTMLFPGVVPWSVLAIMCCTIVGVPLSKYLPYALFLWILPCLTIGISFLRQRNKAKKNKRKHKFAV